MPAKTNDLRGISGTCMVAWEGESINAYKLSSDLHTFICMRVHTHSLTKSINIIFKNRLNLPTFQKEWVEHMCPHPWLRSHGLLIAFRGWGNCLFLHGVATGKLPIPSKCSTASLLQATLIKLSGSLRKKERKTCWEEWSRGRGQG